MKLEILGHLVDQSAEQICNQARDNMLRVWKSAEAAEVVTAHCDRAAAMLERSLRHKIMRPGQDPVDPFCVAVVCAYRYCRDKPTPETSHSEITRLNGVAWMPPGLKLPWYMHSDIAVTPRDKCHVDLLYVELHMGDFGTFFRNNTKQYAVEDATRTKRVQMGRNSFWT